MNVQRPESELMNISKASGRAFQSTSDYIRNPTSKALRQKARVAARNLLLELDDGDDTFFMVQELVTVAHAIFFLMSINALDPIPTSGSISAADLAARVNCSTPLITRMMRMLVCSGFFKETEQDTYAHNRQSLSLVDSGNAALHQVMKDDIFTKSWPALPEYFSARQMEEPNDPKHHPLGVAIGMDGRDWHEVLARTPALMTRIHTAFTGKWSVAPATGLYPFENLVRASEECAATGRVFMVDVGGAFGDTQKEIRLAHPELKGKVITQDQEKVIAIIPAGHLPSELGIEPMSHDFWTPQPVKNAKIYYFRRVLHDWPDEYASKILRHQADVMAEDSVLLVAEMVVPDRVQREDTWVYQLDLSMFMFSGKERSAADFAKLFESAGLELVKIWPSADGSTQAVIEGRKKRV
ncbi:O-methyltransferase hmp5 [Pseudocercospora fuligena]|uniref:O-methyltransferase hmp5 n=1 Tax=Pseudocercospora fuligena TaxID=685502 RepID=A0A8H6RR99_9PEZI|nr:O-methyltransferase hmp5 [Pseudocercospora fuligena]